jgi:uncharacterized membrane protein required for colicin V production
MSELRSIFNGLNFESLSHISIGAALLLIFCVCAAIFLLRVILRIASGSIILALSILVGFWTWRQAPDIGSQWFNPPPNWLPYALPAVAFAVTLLVLRYAVRLIVRPVDKDTPRSPGRRVFAIFTGLIPAALLWIVIATFVHHADSVAEIRAFVEKSSRPGDATPSAFAKHLKDSLEHSIPESWIAAIDPMANHARLTLAKLLSVEKSDLPPRAIPVLDEPALRAIVVDKAQLRSLARDKRYDAVLRHPDLDRALRNPEVRRALEKLDL